MATNDKENESIIFINTKPTYPPGVTGAHWAKLQADIECATSFFVGERCCGPRGKKRRPPYGKRHSLYDHKEYLPHPSHRLQHAEIGLVSYTSLMNLKNRAEVEAQRLGMKASYTHTKRFEVSKDELQVDMIKRILDGLQFLDGPVENFVKVLPRLGESLKNKDKSVMDVEPKWILITTWLYDPYKEKVFASEFRENDIRKRYRELNLLTQLLAMRAIHFLEVSGTAGKEMWWDFSMQLRYEQTDFVFNESIWEESKEEVKKFVDTWAGKNTKKILDVLCNGKVSQYWKK